MNPVSAISWFWRGWRGRSVTFAALFALGVMGVSVLGTFRHVLSRLGAPWYVWLLAPVLVVTILARKEAEWMPDAERRRRWSWGLIGGSIVIALLAMKFAPEKPGVDTEPAARVPGRSGR